MDAITTLARIRPKNQRENKLEGADCLVTDHTNTIYLMTSADLVNKNARGQGFGFDYVMTDESTQLDVFENVGLPAIAGCQEGFNSTVFTYGQTGTGKTFTLLGSPDNPGVIPRLLKSVFDTFEKVDARCTYLEIYQEKVRDLFQSQGGRDLTVRVHPKMGVFVESATVKKIPNTASALALLKEGSDRREVHATKMNATSSRSHTVFSLNLAFTLNKSQLTSKLVLVDLAGRENEKTTSVTGERMNELIFINKSLFFLAQAIRKLADGTKVAGLGGFRDSKLTLLLSDSLTGNSKTSMIAALTYSHSAYDENLATMRFAKSIKLVKTVPLKNIFSAMANKSLQGDLAKEIKAYQKKIQKLQQGENHARTQEVKEDLRAAVVSLKQLRKDNRKMEDMVAEADKKRKQAHKQAKKATQKLKKKQERIDSLENRGLGDYLKQNITDLAGVMSSYTPNSLLNLHTSMSRPSESSVRSSALVSVLSIPAPLPNLPKRKRR